MLGWFNRNSFLFFAFSMWLCSFTQQTFLHLLSWASLVTCFSQKKGAEMAAFFPSLGSKHIPTCSLILLMMTPACQKKKDMCPGLEWPIGCLLTLYFLYILHHLHKWMAPIPWRVHDRIICHSLFSTTL